MPIMGGITFIGCEAMNKPDKQYVSIKFLMDRYGVVRETIYKFMKEYNFPKQVKLTPGSSRWLLSEVEAWEAERETGQH